MPQKYKTIKIIKGCKKHKPDTVIQVSESKANAMISQGLAELYKPIIKKPQKTIEEVKKPKKYTK